MRIHVVDPHGWGYPPTRDIARLKVTGNANALVSPIDDGGLVDLAANQGIGRSAADDTADGTNRPLRWGWATTGTLARTRLVPPTQPGRHPDAYEGKFETYLHERENAKKPRAA